MPEENKKDDGGQAFPLAPTNCGPHGLLYGGAPGMTLRDWFAGQALSHPYTDISYKKTGFTDIAQAAYALADAMLEERKK